MSKEKKATYVDDYIGGFEGDGYAKWFLFLHRLPALLQSNFREWIGKYKLFATWKGNRYRVTGASRLGDVWLAKDFDRDCGYDHRVYIDDLSDFSDSPESK